MLSPHLEIREPCRARLQRLGLRRREAALMLACDENLLCILLRGSARLAHVLESSRGLPFTHASHERAPKLWQGKLQRSSQRELPRRVHVRPLQAKSRRAAVPVFLPSASGANKIELPVFQRRARRSGGRRVAVAAVLTQLRGYDDEGDETSAGDMPVAAAPPCRASP